MSAVAFLLFTAWFFPKWFGGPLIRDALIAWNEGKRLYAEHVAKEPTP